MTFDQFILTSCDLNLMSYIFDILVMDPWILSNADLCFYEHLYDIVIDRGALELMGGKVESYSSHLTG